jgi:hypothetical protein
MKLSEKLISKETQKELTYDNLIAFNHPALTRLANAVENRSIEHTNAYYSRMHNRHNRG